MKTMFIATYDLLRTKYSEPCQSADKIVYEYQDADLEDLKSTNDSFFNTDFIGNNSTFKVAVFIQNNKFKVIFRKKAYDFQALVGNCGGYIGLILGT